MDWAEIKLHAILILLILYIIILFRLFMGARKYRFKYLSLRTRIFRYEDMITNPQFYYSDEGAAFVRKHARALQFVMALIVAIALLYWFDIPEGS